jgi:hypothetical protein
MIFQTSRNFHGRFLNKILTFFYRKKLDLKLKWDLEFNLGLGWNGWDGVGFGIMGVGILPI